VPPEVPGIEHLLPVRFDLQGVGIERGVIDQVRPDPEGTDVEILTVPQECGRLRHHRVPQEECRLRQDAGRSLAHEDGDVRVRSFQQAVVVQMAVADDDSEQRGVVTGSKTVHPRQGYVVVGTG